MRNHWKHSKFVKWVRGYEKPYALTWQGWDEWEKETRAKYPFRYWFAEDFVPKVQDFVTWPAKKFKDARYYVNNRWITKTHAMTSSLKRGRWHELEERMLHCMFDELVNFVEIECAWQQIYWGEDEGIKKYNVPWHARGAFRIRIWRSAAAGVDRLTWAAGLEEQGQPTQQAIDAKETLELYNWWKQVRPARRDPYRAAGWGELCDAGIEAADQTTKETSLKVIEQLERNYFREDEQMMIRLVKLRRSLWT